jgi:hypothetical protein
VPHRVGVSGDERDSGAAAEQFDDEGAPEAGSAARNGSPKSLQS